MNRWEQLTGGTSGEQYAARFAELADRGQDVHGEARLCAALVPPGSRVLDAGCGTGRVLVELARLGYDGVGVDRDASMLAVARRSAPRLTWVQADLADLDPSTAGTGFDLVVAAGNVFPLLAPGTEGAVAAALAGVLRPGGLLVAGFGLDREHLPVPPGLTLAEYDGHCAAAGLTLTDRFATWDADPYEGGGYAVSVHRR
ncbi:MULTISPECIES: bifunctional 2-polyprenyl-6-hydroxyphenol methylase/3-demethylubiquinol 3-O-methyltransferase UbiG [Streptomyces]|uniref:Class I SAM-dependent methyltransferase n=1 Tax=Streptomyces rochei TaxID=1928 RepID=A0AAX3ZVD7_STRRO|nr:MULTISPECIES: class I SAM-dependent methyltransferase [Streptomyces]WDI22681.1 class I SAM-dependent methyltransferase [Streptomyces enissocaesilis]MDI3101072.1 class I SAM-dependent methyltransferase [Streptomyces sp. AN-3]NEC72116.1 class I SAM-dependent methyltransferase [Streptomyces rochei]NUV94719.1 class I SAM-dependent methyltransferase [Streptomyces sp. KAI 90]RSS22490.1 class I SAM-dependent methyltransferase [Streptomyces sp. WAC05458]